ncbi:hypothetical protein COB55_00015 [Candidatus Wolfebacteria bacterium]|nr:MAG: hypothetical protein COB55_00015 [Candidatus Wolfebacteria bacterium]
MENYIIEFAALAGAHLLAVMSPGPDFAIVLRSSLSHSRTEGIWTSVGLGLGILVHVAYSIIGIGLIIQQSVALFNIIKWVGAAYLIYIGCKSLRAKRSMKKDIEIKIGRHAPTVNVLKAIRSGFLTNILNPKTTLFFLALFSIGISPTTPVSIKIIYGAEMSIVTFLWFSFVALTLTQPAVRIRFMGIKHIVERFTGVVLIALGLKIAVSK